MVVNTAKTEVMRVSWDPTSRNVQLTIKGEPVENIDSFVYLGSLLTPDNESIKRRLGLAGAGFKNLLPIWKNKTLSTSLKVRLFNSLIIPIALYSSETWSIKADDERRISAFETKCLRRIAGITYIDRVSNEDLRKLLRCPCTIMDRVRSQQLCWLGHIQRMSANQLPKITFKGRVHGTHPRGLPRKRWTDNFPAYNLPQRLRHSSFVQKRRSPNTATKAGRYLSHSKSSGHAICRQGKSNYYPLNIIFITQTLFIT